MSSLHKLLNALEELYDRVLFLLGKCWDIFGEIWFDIYSAITQFLGRSLGVSLIAFINILVPPPNRSEAILITLVRKLIGIPVAVVFWLALQSLVSTFGFVVNTLGFRSGRDYTFFENLLTWTPGILAAIVLPWIGFTDYGIGQVTLFLSFSLIILGLNMVTGVAGQASIGHGAFVAIGGYVGVIAATTEVFFFRFPLLPAILLGGMISAMFGGFLGLPASRVKGPYLALLTMGLTQILPPLFKSKYLNAYTGGSDGLVFSPPRPPAIFGFLSPSVWIYFHALVFFAVLLIAAHIIVRRTKVGRAFVAIREGEEKAVVLGINVVWHKAFVFMLGAFYAGTGGAILAMKIGFWGPESVTLKDSLDYLVALVVGGVGTNLGSVIGGLFLSNQVFITHFIAKWIKNGEQLLGAVDGIILVCTMMIAPKGIAGLINQWRFLRFDLPTRRSHRRTPPPDFDVEEELIAAGEIAWSGEAMADCDFDPTLSQKPDAEALTGDQGRDSCLTADRDG